MNELKSLFNEHETAREAANKADEAWSLDPENEELETAFDKAYQVEFNLFLELANKISSLTGIDAKAARAMINGKHDELKTLINKIA